MRKRILIFIISFSIINFARPQQCPQGTIYELTKGTPEDIKVNSVVAISGSDLITSVIDDNKRKFLLRQDSCEKGNPSRTFEIYISDNSGYRSCALTVTVSQDHEFNLFPRLKEKECRGYLFRTWDATFSPYWYVEIKKATYVYNGSIYERPVPEDSLSKS